MDDSKLRTFITVCRLGSFTKAADELYLSPVAVKNQIDALEEELGARLLIRKPTGCKLNKIGETFIKDAEKILQAIEDARIHVENANITSREEIIAGHNINFNYSFLGSLSSGFTEVVSDYIIQFERFPRNELLANLETRKISCILAESTLIDVKRHENVVFHPLVSLPVYAIMQKKHELADKEIITVKDLQNREIYASLSIDPQVYENLSLASGGRMYAIEETERNTLFNRIVRNAVEIYPRSFPYYACIPLDIPPVVIGVYTLKKQLPIIKNMTAYMEGFARENGSQLSDIM